MQGHISNNFFIFQYRKQFFIIIQAMIKIKKVCIFIKLTYSSQGSLFLAATLNKFFFRCIQFPFHRMVIVHKKRYIVSLEKPEYYGYFAFISYSEVKSSTHNRKVLRKGVQKLVFFKHYFSEVPYVSSKKK